MKRGASIYFAAVLALTLAAGLWLSWPALEAVQGHGTVLRMPGFGEGAQEDPLRAAFARAAFYSEYGNSGRKPLRRWDGPIGIMTEGQMTAEDEAVIDAFIQQLNDRVPGLPLVSRAAAGQGSVRVRFAKLADLPALSSAYVPGNWGFFTFVTGDGWQIEAADILIATDVTTQKERNHLLLEELVGALGLADDIPGPADSIIFQPWTTVQELSELDWQLLRTLYDSRLKPGMTLEEAERALGWD